MKRVFLVCMMASFSLVAQAQFGVGVNGGYHFWPEASGNYWNYLMYGAHATYGGLANDKLALRTIYTTVGFSTVEGNTGQEGRFRKHLISLDALFFVGSGTMTEGGLYLAPGAGFASARTTAGDLDPNSNTATQVYARGMAGYSHVVGEGIALFGEGFVNLPIPTGLSGIIGTQVGINAGVRKQF
jgi:hypothetical protein